MNSFFRLITVGLLIFSSFQQTFLPSRWYFSGLAPVAYDDAYSMEEGGTLQVPVSGTPYNGVLFNDEDQEDPILEAFVVDDAQHGTLVLVTDGSLTYTPYEENWYGSETFSYRAYDGTGYSNVANVTITVDAVDDLPVAVEDTYTTNEDTLLSVPADGVLGNDILVDPDETITALLDSYTGDGDLSLNADGSFTYTPAQDFNGVDSFTYSVNDGTQDSNTVTVTLNVTAINDPPLAVADAYSTPEDVDLTVPALTGVLDNDSDAEGQPLTAVTDSLPANGSLDFEPDGSFTYNPDENWSGTDGFSYHALAGGLSSEVVDVVLTVDLVNDIPVASNDTYDGTEDVPLTIQAAEGVLFNDSDIENSPLSAHLNTQPLRGNVVMASDGSFTYTPQANDFGTLTFQYHVNDGTNNSPLATVTLQIAAVNDPPTAANDSYSTTEDTNLTVTPNGILANDSDVESGSVFTPALSGGPGHGTLDLETDGSFTYEPDDNFNGTDTFTYTITDNGGVTSNSATVEISVTAVNDAPVAGNDDYDLVEDIPFTVAASGILVNDSDIDEDLLTVAAVVQQPAHGSVAVNPDGGFTYTPEANHHGSVFFTYRATDGQATSNLATVTLNVQSVNDAPVALDNAYSTDEDTQLIIAAAGVLSNDSDVDQQTLTAVVDVSTLHGTLALGSAGGFTYTPEANWNGTDSFTYHATDEELSSNIATVTIVVGAVNDNPTASPDDYDAMEDTPLTVPVGTGVLANDDDIENAPLHAIMGAQPLHGSVALNEDGSFTYTPASNFNGQVTFTYRVSDGTAQSDLTIVTLTISAVNDPPVPFADTYTTAEDTQLIVTGLGVITNDQDVDNGLATLSAYLVSGPDNGTLALHSDGSFEYMPDDNHNGSDHFTYYLRDNLNRSVGEATVTITIPAVNDVPVAVDDTYSTTEDTQLSITLPASGILGNDTDVDGDPLRAIWVNGPLHGALSLNQNGTFLYTPELNHNGTDFFTYRASDGTAQSPLPAAVVTINISATNDAPVANAQSPTTAEDTAIHLTLIATDVDRDTLIYSIFTPPVHGVLTGALPNLVYTPHLNYNGQDSFVFQVTDGLLTASATVQLTVTPVNDAPVGVGDAYTFAEDAILTIAASGVLANDSDVDSGTLTVSPTISPSHGTLVLNTNGAFTYTPVTNYHGPDSFSYRVSDGSSLFAIALVNLNITPVNDPPVSRSESYTGNEDIPIIVNQPGLLLNDSDVDGDILNAALDIASGPAHGDVDIELDGSFTYTPDENYNGNDSFSYTTTDGTITTPPTTVSITLVAVNDAPDTLDDAYSTPMDTVIEIPAPGLLANDSDVDDENFTAILVEGPSRGTIEAFNPDGSFRYRTPINGQGPVTFKYTATDGKNESLTSTVTIQITTTQQLSMKWVSPVKDNHRYFVGAEEIPLETLVTIPDGFPCIAEYMTCDPAHTYVVSTLVRYYIYISGTWYDIAVVEGPNFRHLFDTGIINKNIRTSELAAVATIQVTEKDEFGNQIGDPDIYATPRARIYIYRIPFDNIIRHYLPYMYK